MALNLQMKNGIKHRLREQFPAIGKARKESGCKTSDLKLIDFFLQFSCLSGGYFLVQFIKSNWISSSMGSDLDIKKIIT